MRNAMRAAALSLMLVLALDPPVLAASGQQQEVDRQHAGHQQEKPRPGAKPESANPPQEEPELPPFIAPVTDEDRQAAFPEVGGHAVHGQSVHSFVLFDQLEWRMGDSEALNLDAKGWLGGDLNRLWFRGEGGRERGGEGAAEAHALYGRAVRRWWDVVAGVRQDFAPGPARTWLAFGVQGLAPYWFEIEATGYVGAAGRTQARLEVEYELRLTRRLVLQPLVELDFSGKADAARGIGAGLSTTDAGLRLRYEWRRELAPYLGLVWTTKHGGTADLARAAGESTGGAHLAAGLRMWF